MYDESMDDKNNFVSQLLYLVEHKQHRNTVSKYSFLQLQPFSRFLRVGLRIFAYLITCLVCPGGGRGQSGDVPARPEDLHPGPGLPAGVPEEGAGEGHQEDGEVASMVTHCGDCVCACVRVCVREGEGERSRSPNLGRQFLVAKSWSF